MERPSPANGYQSGHAALLLASFQRFVGRPLLDPGLAAAEWARALFEAPFVVVSHDAGADPVLTYGNEAALALWEADWEAFTHTPSRLTAEPLHRDERARMLEETDQRGFIDNYEGIRISATGRRFRISNAIVWNLVDANGAKVGQAATFAAVEFLSPTASAGGSAPAEAPCSVFAGLDPAIQLLASSGVSGCPGQARA